MIHDYETGENELFNLRTDISAKHNLAEIHPERTEKMKNRLDQWLDETHALLPKVVDN